MDIDDKKRRVSEGFDLAGMFRRGTVLPPLLGRFFDVLADAETRFGPRNREWTFGGIVLCSEDEAAPHVSPGPNKQCFLALTTSVLEGPDILDWQLTHEAVHLLNPGPKPLVTNLEEGVAAYNAWRQRRDVWGKISNYSGKPHEVAFNLAMPLLEAHPEGVKALRNENGIGLSPVTAALITKHFPSATSDVAELLAKPFY